MRVRALVLLAVGLIGCSDAFIEPKPKDDNNVDNRLTLGGRVCTDPPDPSGFPVKVVLIVDQSGSMCVSDPPGAQEVTGFCEQIASLVVPPGVTEPARVRAVKKLLAQFSTQPNVQVSLVPFETNVKNPYPPATGGGAGVVTSRFTPASNPGLLTAVSNLQSQLGKGTDYQGALSYAYGVIAEDIAIVSSKNPELLPRTRYVVVFLTDGTPFPKCAGNDNLSQYADSDNPELLWADSSGAGDFCNLMDPDPTNPILPGYVPGTDRNQNYQLFSYIDQIMELKTAYNIGDIRLHTVLLFNEAAVAACGTICTDIYGTYTNTTPANYPAAAHKIATWVLTQMAQRGNGVYQEFLNGNIQQLGLGALDYSSLAAPNVMKQLLVKAMSSVPGRDDREVDTDGDGLPDSLDNGFTWKTNPFFADTDGDCFDDDFEVRHYSDGFRPDVKDGRGCDPLSPLTPGCTCADTDGDGLSYQVEAYLKTNDTLVDTDGDGIPDGLEVRYGLDPLVPQAKGLDTDGDGIPDVVEMRADSSPIARDNTFFDKEAYQYQANAVEQPDKSVCYDFSVSNLKLVTPPKQAGVRQGYNLFKVWFAEAPQSGIASDYGVWRTACAWAQYDPPSIRVPAAPDLKFANTDFIAPRMLVTPPQYQTGCIGTPP